MNHDDLMKDWFDNKLTTTEFIHEVKTLRELLDKVLSMMNDNDLENMDLHHVIKTQLFGEN